MEIREIASHRTILGENAHRVFDIEAFDRLAVIP